MRDNTRSGDESGVYTDRSLLRRLRSGEQDAATALYRRYAPRVEALAKLQTSSALASRLDAEDVVQSVFRTFFRRAASGQYEVPKSTELWNLLYVISLNKIRSLAAHHRADKRAVAATEAWSDGEHADTDAEQHGLVLLQLVIDDVLVSLPESQRRMVTMRIEGRHVTEIAAATGRSMRSVERLLQDFRSRLSRLIFQEPCSHGG
jgi:RNA polymerase sigma-70 factor (ECF subfamily)